MYDAVRYIQMWSILKLRPLVERATGRLNVVQAPVDGDLAPSLNASADDRSLDGDGQLSAQNTDVQVFAQQAAGPRPPKDPSKPKSIDTLYKSALPPSPGGNGPGNEFCRSILEGRSSHINARAELGRLRFRSAPTAAHRRDQASQPDRHLRGHHRGAQSVQLPVPLLRRVAQRQRPVAPFDLEEVERSLSAIPAKLVVISFDAGGGEPTIHPQFPELLRLCATRGPVSFPTNNSPEPGALAAERRRKAYLYPGGAPPGGRGAPRQVRAARALPDRGRLRVFEPLRVASGADTQNPEVQEVLRRHGRAVHAGLVHRRVQEGQRYPHAYRRKRRRCSV